MRFLTVMLMLGVYVLGGCTIVQKEATTTSEIGDIFSSHSASKKTSTEDRKSKPKISKPAVPVSSPVVIEKQAKQWICPACGRKFSSSGDCPYDGNLLKAATK